MVKRFDRTREFTDAGSAHSQQMSANLDRDSYHTALRKTGTGNKLVLRTKGEMQTIWGSKGIEIYLDNGFIDPGEYGSASSVTVEMAEPDKLDKTASTDSRYLLVEKLPTDDELEIDPTEWSDRWLSFTTKSAETEPAGTSSIPFSVLKDKNRAVLTCPPTAFSGLARRYVAAIYGRELGEAQAYGLSANSAGAYAALEYDGVTLSPASTGIFYDEAANRYWMIRLSSDTMTYVQMVQTEVGDAMIDYLIDPNVTPEEKILLHTYVLSETYVPKEDDGTIKWRDGGTFTTVGGPLNFGWRWNKWGTKATMTTMYKPNLNFNSSYLYSATIALTEDPLMPENDVRRYTLTATIVEDEAKLLWASNRIKLFYPVGPGEYMWLRTGYVTGEAPNVPLLSFYDDDDALQVCRFNVSPGRTDSLTEGGYDGSVLTQDYQYPTYNDNAYGWGDGYSWERMTRLPGDGCQVSLGGLGGSDVVLNDHHTLEYVVSKGAEGPTIGLIDATFGAPFDTGYGAFGVNGSENTGNSATWPFSGKAFAYVSPYTWTADGRYIGTEVKLYTTLFVAPHDCATAWLESMYEIETLSTVIERGTPAANTQNQHTTRWVQATITPEGYYVETGPAHGEIQQALVNISHTNEPVPDEVTAVTTAHVRNAKGRYSAGSYSNNVGGAPGPFWNATVIDPGVTFDMLVQDDIAGVSTASNILGGAAMSNGWPANTLRAIGWQ